MRTQAAAKAEESSEEEDDDDEDDDEEPAKPAAKVLMALAIPIYDKVCTLCFAIYPTTRELSCLWLPTMSRFILDH